MRAVVVGGQGFLGGAIVSELLARGDTVTVYDASATNHDCDQRFGPDTVRVVRGDVSCAAGLLAAVEGTDEIYHLAGVLGTSELEDSVLDAVQGNVVGSVNVFEAAIAARVPTVFFPSKPNVWLNTYTITKFAAEQFARLYSSLHPVRIPSLRYFNAYGPHQSMSPIRKMVPTFAVQAIRGQPLTVFDDGGQTVDLIFSSDLARCTVDFTRTDYDGEAIDCGRGVGMSVIQVATAVNDFFANKGGIRHLPMRRGEHPATELVAETKALDAVLGGLDFADFETSLSQTLLWYASRSEEELDRAAVSLAGA